MATASARWFRVSSWASTWRRRVSRVSSASVMSMAKASTAPAAARTAARRRSARPGDARPRRSSGSLPDACPSRPASATMASAPRSKLRPWLARASSTVSAFDLGQPGPVGPGQPARRVHDPGRRRRGVGQQAQPGSPAAGLQPGAAGDSRSQADRPPTPPLDRPGRAGLRSRLERLALARPGPGSARACRGVHGVGQDQRASVLDRVAGAGRAAERPSQAAPAPSRRRLPVGVSADAAHRRTPPGRRRCSARAPTPPARSRSTVGLAHGQPPRSRQRPGADRQGQSRRARRRRHRRCRPPPFPSRRESARFGNHT